MNEKRIRRLLLVATMVVLLLAVSGPTNPSSTPDNANKVLLLQPPSFVGIARAEGNSVPAVIESEAGISAWLQSPFPITLTSVRSVFRVIEAETSDHIIGTVQVPNYDESEEIHVYVHRDGWILGYYPSDSPVSRIFDWYAYHTSGRASISTRLENTLAVVTSAAGVPYSGVNFYDFRYPNASHLMLISEWGTGVGDSFSVKLPANYGYYERSWSLGDSGGCYPSFLLNGGPIYEETSSWGVWGILTAGQLVLEQTHWVTIDPKWSCHGYYGGLALMYRVP